MVDFSTRRRNKRIKKEEVIEQLSEIEHIQWVEWSQNIAEQLRMLEVALQGYRDKSSGREPSDEWKELVRDGDEFGGQILIFEVRERLNRWEKLWQTPYAELTEEQKESDRRYARRAYEVMK
jgi:hypothetical protein